MAVARERDNPVAHVPLFEQHENHQDGHEPGRAEGRQQARDPRRQTEVDAHLVGDHDRRRLADRRIRLANVFLDVFLELFERRLDTLDGAATARVANVDDFLPDVRSIAGQIARQARDLPGESPRQHRHRADRDRDHQHDGGASPNPPREPVDPRVEQEGEQQRASDGQEDGLRPVEQDDKEHAASKDDPGTQPTHAAVTASGVPIANPSHRHS